MTDEFSLAHAPRYRCGRCVDADCPDAECQPHNMVGESDVAALQHAVRAYVGETAARHIQRDAGRRTAD